MELIMLCGLPGSGKSTARMRLLMPHVCFNPDRLKFDAAGKYCHAMAKTAWANELHRYGLWLSSGGLPPYKSLGVWDAVLADPITRAPLLHIAKGMGVTAKAMYMNTPYDVCVERNMRRMPDRRVPMKAMENFRARLKAPTLEEGFDEVQVITYAPPEAAERDHGVAA